MNRNSSILWAALLAALPAVVIAQESTPTPGQQPGYGKPQESASQPASDQAKVEAEAQGQAQAQAQAQANAEARTKLDAVLAKGAKASAKTRADAETKIAASLKQVDDGAAKEGDSKLAERLAVEFGMSADALMAQKQALGASWGELMIAHTLEANSKTDLTVEQIYEMKKEGNGWGQIAHGLDLSLGEVVSAMRAESRVALGLAKPDGKVHPIKALGANVKGAAGAGVKTGKVGVGVDAGAGVDLNVKPGKP
jgi:hypothetical protein